MSTSTSTSASAPAPAVAAAPPSEDAREITWGYSIAYNLMLARNYNETVDMTDGDIRVAWFHPDGTYEVAPGWYFR